MYALADKWLRVRVGQDNLAVHDVLQGRPVPLADYMMELTGLDEGFVLFDLGALDQELEWSDSGEVEPGDYYYVRVTQLDGARAWSSPFWVGRNE